MAVSCLDLPVYSYLAGLRATMERVLPLFAQAGLKVAVVDYRAAEKTGESTGLVPVGSAGTHPAVAGYSFEGRESVLLVKARKLLCSQDLLFIAGEGGIQGCWQLAGGENSTGATASIPGHRLVLPAEGPQEASECILAHAGGLLRKKAVWACILIGGKSSRMGRPKHLIQDKAGQTWLERLVKLIEPHVAGIVLSGKGEVPESLGSLTRIPDIPGVQGPLTGIVSAMRGRPEVSWLLLACDMPHITDKAVRWLLANAALGVWASLPTITGGRTVEPLFARYEPQSRSYFESLCALGELRIGRIADFSKVKILPVPEGLHPAWSNINTPQELQSLSL